jgi:hypothetical protein
MAHAPPPRARSVGPNFRAAACFLWPFELYRHRTAAPVRRRAADPAAATTTDDAAAAGGGRGKRGATTGGDEWVNRLVAEMN